MRFTSQICLAYSLRALRKQFEAKIYEREKTSNRNWARTWWKTSQNEMMPCMQTLWGILKRCICVLPVRYAPLIRYGRFETSLKRKIYELHKTSNQNWARTWSNLHRMRWNLTCNWYQSWPCNTYAQKKLNTSRLLATSDSTHQNMATT